MKTFPAASRHFLSRATRLVPLAAFVAGSSLSTPASADWDGAIAGTISGFDSVANDPNNYELRVMLTGVSTICKTADTDVQGFAYLNSVDNNFKATLAILLTAYTTGKTVTLFTMDDNHVGCHLHYVTVR